MKMQKTYWIYFFCFWLLSITVPLASNAQALYPVTASLDIQGPYSPLFYTFGDPSSQAFRPNKIVLRLRLNDLSEPNLTVRLKWEVSGPSLDFATQDDYVGNLVDLSPGQFVNFDNGQLSGYFDAIANGGISQRDIDGNGGYLPEGNYTFCVTAYEIAKGQQVSNSTCRSIYIEEYEPPVLNLPDEVVKPSYPQNVLVSWTPRHFTIFPVIYHIKVWDKIEGLTPDQVSMAQLPFIEYDVPQVNQSFITSMQPLLIPGTSYWIQVQVRDNINPGGLPSVIFKNNGNSVIEEFYYGTEEELQLCTAPLSLIGEVGDDKTVHLTWNSGDALNTPLGGLQALAYSGGSSTLAYLIKYRNIDSLYWVEVGTTSATNYDLTGLKRGKTYEIQVIKVCLNGLEEGPIIQVTIPKGVQRKGECGVPMTLDGLSTEPLDELLEGDTISAGDVLINVLSVEGSSGVFSGTGYFQMPMFGKFRLGVHFHAITVNEDYILTDGEIITNFDQKKADALQSYDVKKDLVEVNVIVVKSTFKILKVEAGGCLVEVDGVEKWAPNGTVLKGAFNNVIYNGILFERFEESEEFDSVGSIRIEFIAGENQKYGFDGFKKVIEKEYKMLEGEPIPYKSVAVEATDGVGARIIKGQWNGTDTIFFVEEKTKMIIPHTQSGKEFKLNVPGFGWESDVVAYVDNVGVAGRLHLYSTPITKVNVTVVNVNGAGAANLSSLTEETNKITSQGLFSVNLHGGAPFNYTETEDGIINVANHFLNAYSPDMKKLADAYFKDNGTIENEFYLFVIDNMEAGTAGMMPQGYAAGFISDMSFNAATIAHELGHGIFNFDHSWFMYLEMAEGTGINLMDYADSTETPGTSLFFRQWQQMASPGFPKGWRKDEGAGSSITDPSYFCFEGERANSFEGNCFIDYSGNPIFLDGRLTQVAFYSSKDSDKELIGRLASWRFESDGLPFVPNLTPKGEFIGYMNSAKVVYTTYQEGCEYPNLVIGDFTDCSYTINKLNKFQGESNCNCGKDDSEKDKPNNGKTPFVSFNGETFKEKFESTKQKREENFEKDLKAILNGITPSKLNSTGIGVDENFESKLMEDRLWALFTNTGKDFNINVNVLDYVITKKTVDSIAEIIYNENIDKSTGAFLFINLFLDKGYQDILNPNASKYFIQACLVDPNGIIESKADLEGSPGQIMASHYLGISKPHFTVVYKEMPGGRTITSVKEDYELKTGQGAITDFEYWKYSKEEPFITVIPSYSTIELHQEYIREAMSHQNDPNAFDISRIENLKDACIIDQFKNYGDEERKGEFLSYLSSSKDKIPSDCVFERLDGIDAVVYPALNVLGFIPYVGAVTDYFGLAIASYRGDVIQSTEFGAGIFMGLMIGGKVIGKSAISASKGLVVNTLKNEAVDLAERNVNEVAEFMVSVTPGLTKKRGTKFAEKLYARNIDKYEDFLNPQIYDELIDVSDDIEYDFLLRMLFDQDKNLKKVIDAFGLKKTKALYKVCITDKQLGEEGVDLIFKFFGDLSPPKNEEMLSLFVNSNGRLRDLLFAGFKGGSDQALGKQLLEDIKLAEDDAFGNYLKRSGDEGVGAWEKVIKHADLRSNVGFLENIKDFSKKLIDELNADLSNSKWKTELTEFFIKNPEDVRHIWKELKENPSYHWEIYETEGFIRGSQWEKWSQREFFKDITKKGKDFELDLLISMKTRSGSAYNSLKNRVPDLDERYMLSQVQFCLPGLYPPCNNKGDYFIADQVWLKFDSDGDIVDMVIVDAKLSKGTSLTPGQTAAKNNVGGDLSYKPAVTLVTDDFRQTLPTEITQGTQINASAFYKAYGDGKGLFVGVE